MRCICITTPLGLQQDDISVVNGILWCGAEGFIRLYRLVDNGRKLELVHKTAVGGIPGALAAFKGRLLVGVGPIVRLYDLGKKKLLRKSEYRR